MSIPVYGSLNLLANSEGQSIFGFNATGDLSGSDIQSFAVTAVKGYPAFKFTQPIEGEFLVFLASSISSSKVYGDVTGAYSALAVNKVRGINVVATTPNTGQYLRYDGTNWSPSAQDTTTTVTMGGDVTGASNASSVTGVRGKFIDASELWNTNGFLNYNGTKIGVSAVAGDVTGTIDALAVAKIRGITMSSVAPVAGQIITATSTTSAYWGSPSFIAMPTTQLVATAATASVNNIYISTSSSRNYLTLPAAATVGDTIRLVGRGQGGWRLVNQANQYVCFGVMTTSTGTAGFIDSTHFRDAIHVLCTSANLEWTVMSSMGSPNVG